MKASTDILHKNACDVILERFIELTETYILFNGLPLITRSRRLLMLASAFSFTQGATMSLSEVYYLIMKSPLTESSRIFMTSYEMNYFWVYSNAYVSFVHFGVWSFVIKLYKLFYYLNFDLILLLFEFKKYFRFKQNLTRKVKSMFRGEEKTALNAIKVMSKRKGSKYKEKLISNFC